MRVSADIYMQLYLSNQLYCDKDLIDLHYKLSEFCFIFHFHTKFTEIFISVFV